MENRNYLIENYIDINELRKEFPNIIFRPITPKVIEVDIPEEAQGDIGKLEAGVRGLTLPSLYGLNAQPNLEGTNITFFHNYAFGELRGTGILVGFVDTGIDYTNPLFQYEDQTTRILGLWDQTGPPGADDTMSIGRVYSEEEINQALKSANPLEVVPAVDEIGHGTFLAGVAAGDDRSGQGTYEGGAPDAQLLVVKLRPAKQYLREYYLIEDGAIAYQDNDILAGVRYLIDTARDMNKPLALCIGLGNNWGAHNGTAIMERTLEETTILEKLVVTIAAGNEANQGHHFEGMIKQDETKDVEINIAEAEKGVILQVWANRIDRLAVSLTSPLGYQVPKVPSTNNTVTKVQLPLEKSQVTITYMWPDSATGAGKIEVKIQEPTPGIWQLKVYGDFVVNGDYNIWLPREGFIRPNTRFVSSEAYTTVCIPATSEQSMVVGAYDNKDESIYAASGRGPTTNQMIKPDFIAPGVNVVGPNTKGGLTTYTGTSVSAAITTSASALLLQWAVLEDNLPRINTRIAKTIFIRGAQRRNNVTYPNNIEGYGRLDLKNSLSLM
ncbi:MAG: S8 family peptidase [Cellulosilyticaceae bacterium]